MREFAQLYRQGDATIAQRKQLEIRQMKLKECKSLLKASP